MALSEPRSTSDIAAFAGVAPDAADVYLQDLLERGQLFAVEHEQETKYYPDPVTSYVERLREITDWSGLPADPGAVRADVAAWRDRSEVETLEDAREYLLGARLAAASRLPVGCHVYDHDWDILVVLDTCRVDALRPLVDGLGEVVSSDVTARRSLGSQTAEWLCQTFTADHRDEIARTGYVAGNGWVRAVFDDGLRPDDDVWYQDVTPPTQWDVVDDEQFGALVHAWQRERFEYSTDVPWSPHPSPRTVTDHAIALSRERQDLDRLVVHYKQPHAPYTLTAERQGRRTLARYERAPFDYLADGGSRDAVWNAYLRDLRVTLEEVATLCRNADGRVLVTADHGEAFGENGEYGHRPAMLHPAVRHVPWLWVTATDEETREGDLSSYERTDRDVDDQLEALGYR